MMGDTNILKYEEQISSDQELTLRYTLDVFKTAKVAFERPHYITLGLLTTDDVFTNLGLLLSDQCSHFIEAEVYEGEDTSVCKQLQIIAGPLTAQFHYALLLVGRNSYGGVHFDPSLQLSSKFYRFPTIAVREALLNALIHRDYSAPHATKLKIFSNRLELISPGGLLQNITVEDIERGLSVPRNEKLAQVFHQIEWAEIGGTGIPKIFKEYDNYASKPRIIADNDQFSITLPSIPPPDSAMHTDLFA